MPVSPRTQEVARATEHTLIRVAEELANVTARLGSTLSVNTVMPSDYPDANAHTLLNDVILRLSNILTELQAAPDTTPVTVQGTVPVSDGGASLTIDGTVAVSNFPATQPISGTVGVSNHPTEMGLPAAQVTDLKSVVVTSLPAEVLATRMLNKKPSEGYAMWFDTTSEAHLYVMEAPVADNELATTFRGVRIPISNGNPLGKVQTVENIAWADRYAASGWA